MKSQISAIFDDYLGTFQGAGELFVQGNEIGLDARKPYLSAIMASYTRAPQSIDADAPFLESGVYQVTVARPTAEGRSAGETFADLVLAFFPRGMGLATVAGQVARIDSGTVLPMIAGGAWLQFPIQIRWFAWEGSDTALPNFGYIDPNLQGQGIDELPTEPGEPGSYWNDGGVVTLVPIGDAGTNIDDLPTTPGAPGSYWNDGGIVVQVPPV